MGQAVRAVSRDDEQGGSGGWRGKDRGVSDPSRGTGECRTIHSEPGDECVGIFVPKGAEGGAGGAYRRGPISEGSAGAGGVGSGGGAAHSALDRGDGRPGYAIAVRERIADYGVCSVAGARRGFCVPADYGTIRKREQGSGARSTPRPLGGRPGRAWNRRGRAAGTPHPGAAAETLFGRRWRASPPWLGEINPWAT